MSWLEMRGITKVYPNGLRANDSIDFAVERGEIHAIIGENGAGKSTLMKVLCGLEHADAGTILLGDRRIAMRNPHEADRRGIAMVHQQFRLIGDFSVAENVVLGREPTRARLFMDRAKAEDRIAGIISRHGFSIDPRDRVSDLTVGQMQQVEIVRMLYHNAELLILDEPTSVLAEQEIHRLFETLRSLRADGRTCIIITHKLREVKEISDRVTVMRRGKVVAVRATAEVDKAELSRLMVGKSRLYQIERAGTDRGDAVLELRDVVMRQRGRARPLLDRVSLTVHAGEIVGVAGVSGNGLSELEDAVTGLRRITSGQILHNGEDISRLSTATLRRQGLAYVPADRLRRGASLAATVMENMTVTHHHRFLRGGFLNDGEIEQFAERLSTSFSIDGGPRVAVGTLSGGTIQKVILARELASGSNLLVVSEPTWGLDVASSQFVYEKILGMRAEGAGVLFISSNLDEVLGVADTIAVMYRGRLVALFPNAPHTSKELVGEYMLGLRDDSRPAETAQKRDVGG